MRGLANDGQEIVEGLEENGSAYQRAEHAGMVLVKRAVLPGCSPRAGDARAAGGAEDLERANRMPGMAQSIGSS